LAAAIDIEEDRAGTLVTRSEAPRLTSHLRALALLQPLQRVEESKASRQWLGAQTPQQLDARYLALATISFLIDRMGIGGVATRIEILQYLESLACLQCPDIAAADAVTIAEHVFDGLINMRDRRARFRSTHFDPQHTERVTTEFALVRAEPVSTGGVGYRLTQEAIEVHLSLLAQDPLTATQVNEMIVDEYLRRGLYDEAANAAERARTNSIRLAEAVRTLMAAAHRAIRKVLWQEELGPRLEEARDLLDTSIEREGAMLRHLNDTTAEISEETERRHIARLRQLLHEVQSRHRGLSVIVQRTASDYLALQVEALRARTVSRLPDLEREILEPCLQAPVDFLTGVGSRIFEVISGALPPMVLDLGATIAAFEPDPLEDAVPEEGSEVAAPSTPMPPTFEDALIERTEAFARSLIAQYHNTTLAEILQRALDEHDPDSAFVRCLFWVLEQAVDPHTGTIAKGAAILNRRFTLQFVSGSDVRYSREPVATTVNEVPE
jgi:hypothetical protein